MFCSTVLAMAAVSPHPNVSWTADRPFGRYDIEIALDAGFAQVVDRDHVSNITRYVPARALEAGDYFWRATDDLGTVWTGSFTIANPLTRISIPTGAGMDEIRSTLARARHSSSTLIQFEEATYHLHPGDQGTVFAVTDTRDLIIDGSGSKLIIHGIASLAEVVSSRHITLRNFKVDYDAPLYTAAKVETIESDGTLELSLWPGCVAPESVERFMEEQRGLFCNPRHPRMAEGVPLLVHMNAPWQPLGGGRYRLQAATPGSVAEVRPGMVYVCAPRYKAQGIELFNSEDITVVDVTTYYLPGIGVSSTFTNDLKLIRLNMLRREDRLLGVQNGGTNIHNARIGPWVEGCRFENTGDDCNHLNALLLSPVTQPGPAVVVVSHGQPGIRVPGPDMDVRPGDVLAFFDRPTGSVLAEAEVVSVEVRSRRSTRIELDRAIPNVQLAGGDGRPELDVTQIYNLSRACGNYAFRHNVFVRGRRMGILAKSGPGLIEHNRFEELGGEGVAMLNAPYEGLHAHEVLVEHNLFRRGGLTWRRQGPAPAIWLEIFAGAPSQRLHRDIRILDNVILDYRAHAVSITDAVDVLVTGNRIEVRDPDVERVPDAEPVRLENVERTVVRDNVVVGRSR